MKIQYSVITLLAILSTVNYSLAGDDFERNSTWPTIGEAWKTVDKGWEKGRQLRAIDLERYSELSRSCLKLLEESTAALMNGSMHDIDVTSKFQAFHDCENGREKKSLSKKLYPDDDAKIVAMGNASDSFAQCIVRAKQTERYISRRMGAQDARRCIGSFAEVSGYANTIPKLPKLDKALTKSAVAQTLGVLKLMDLFRK